MISFFKSNIGHEEIKSTTRVLRSGFLTQGKYNEIFENQFLKKITSRKNFQACAVSSCTSALLLALRILDVKNGDEVILPSLTFVADANVVLQLGAKPVFCDSISIDDWNIDPSDIEKKISKKTKAIIIVHFAGFPCKLNKINKISKKYKIPVIEDSCHALFSKYKNKYLGTRFDISTFSFYGNKNFTTGEGGMLIGKKKYVSKAYSLKSHGQYKKKLQKFNPTYDIYNYGYNFRMTDLQASIGIEQLKKIKRLNRERKTLYNYYCSQLNRLNLGYKIPFQNFDKNDYSFHIFPVLLPRSFERDKVINFLYINKIQTSIHYHPIHLFRAYKKYNTRLKVVESFYKRIITLPLYPKLTKKNIDYIVQCLKKYAINHA